VEEPLVAQSFIETFSQYLATADFEMPVKRAKKILEVTALVKKKPRAVLEALLICLDEVFSIRDYHPSSDPRETEIKFREYSNALTTARAICEVVPELLPPLMPVGTLLPALGTLQALFWDADALRTIAVARNEVREFLSGKPPKGSHAKFRLSDIFRDRSATRGLEETANALQEHGVTKSTAYRWLADCRDDGDENVVSKDKFKKHPLAQKHLIC